MYKKLQNIHIWAIKCIIHLDYNQQSGHDKKKKKNNQQYKKW